MASQLCTGLLLCLSLLFDVVLTSLNDFQLRHVGDYPSVFSCGKVVTSFTGFNFSMNLFCLTKGLRFVSIDCSFTHSIELCCKTRNDNDVLSSRENSFILVVRIFPFNGFKRRNQHFDHFQQLSDYYRSCRKQRNIQRTIHVLIFL